MATSPNIRVVRLDAHAAPQPSNPSSEHVLVGKCAVLTCLQLGATFAVRFEAPHVINARTQVWAGAIGAAPDGSRMVATYDETNKPAFQVACFGCAPRHFKKLPCDRQPCWRWQATSCCSIHQTCCKRIMLRVKPAFDISSSLC